MEMQCNVELLNEWIARNEPEGREKLAKRAGMSVSGLYKILARKRFPRPETLVALGRAVKVDPALLVVVEKPRRKRIA